MHNSRWRTALRSAVLCSALVSFHARALDRISQAEFGKTDDGTVVKLVTLRNSKGMSAQIISYGAIIKELWAPDRDGNFTNVLLTTDSIEKFQHGFAGAAAVTGRVVNRIAGAQFDLDGVTYHLTPNEGKNTIHGGRKGFAQSVWNVTNLSSQNDQSSVALSYVSKDGEEGFPGTLQTVVTYTLNDKNEFSIEYVAVTDKPTVVNLSNHAYWNLAGGGPCLDNVLFIPSESYTPTGAGLIPTGDIKPIKGTPFDFSQPTRIGEHIDDIRPKTSGYDLNYVLSGGHEMKLAARLTEPISGRVMEVRTTQPAVQLYTANHLAHTAVCLETQHYPDAIHHPNFPSIIIRTGDPLKETTVYSFSVK